MAKSMRNAFIRVSAENNTTQNGVVLYTFEQICNSLKEWSKSKSLKYYAIEHNNEQSDTNKHFHIVLVFGAPTPFDSIKKQFPYGDIESAKNVKNCVQYLVHLNDDSKLAYEWEQIFTNDKNLDKFKTISASKQIAKLEEYIRKIDDGTIREYNLTDNIPIEIFANYKTRIINALEYYRRKVMTDKNRDIKVMIYSGDTGTYKTTYAKQYARNLNKSICISSSSNDPMQDYKGEDIMVLDDLRDKDFKFHDLLKVLDNHTKSSVQSRYNNKAFIGDTIIITTSQPISEWYYDETKEDKEQLYRRIPIQMQFTKDKITIFQFNEKAHKYVYVGSLPNMNSFKPEETKSKIVDIIKAMGVDVDQDTLNEFMNTDIKDEYKNMELGQIEQKFEQESLLSFPLNNGNNGGMENK